MEKEEKCKPTCNNMLIDVNDMASHSINFERCETIKTLC